MTIYCSHWFNKEPTGQELGRKRLGRRARLKEHWEGGWGHQPATEEAGDEHAVVKKRDHHMVEHR